MLLSVCPGSEWVDPYDPTVVAESELLSAANSIEAAARKLSQLQPRELVSKVCTVWHNALFIARGGGLLYSCIMCALVVKVSLFFYHIKSRHFPFKN